MVALALGSVHYRETEKNPHRSELKTPQRKRPKANVCVMFSTFRSKSSHLPHCLMPNWTPHTPTQSHWSKLREKIKKEHIPYLTGVHNCLKQLRAPQHQPEVWAEDVWASNGPVLTWLQPFLWLFEPLKNCSKICHLTQPCSWDRSFTFGHKRWKGIFNTEGICVTKRSTYSIRFNSVLACLALYWPLLGFFSCNGKL